MSEGEPAFQGFKNKKGQTCRASRQELARDNGETLTQPEERALLKCFQRLAVLPKVEGLALSQIKLHGGLYLTVIERDIFSGDEEAAQTFEGVTDALDDFGRDIDQILPDSFITLNGKTPFGAAIRILKREDRSELDLLVILHFI